jgi:hypothetical protein
MYDVSNDGPEVYPEIRVNRMDNSVPRRQVDVELAFSVPITKGSLVGITGLGDMREKRI